MLPSILDEKFEMMLDTGCSVTLINPKIAKALKVKPEGKHTVTLADGKKVEMAYGFVDSIEAGGIKADDVAVFIGGSEKEPGLLGQNFYGDYKVVIDRDRIEFKR